MSQISDAWKWTEVNYESLDQGLEGLTDGYKKGAAELLSAPFCVAHIPW
jgi:hypothetical protein